MIEHYKRGSWGGGLDMGKATAKALADSVPREGFLACKHLGLFP